MNSFHYLSNSGYYPSNWHSGGKIIICTMYGLSCYHLGYIHILYLVQSYILHSLCQASNMTGLGMNLQTGMTNLPGLNQHRCFFFFFQIQCMLCMAVMQAMSYCVSKILMCMSIIVACLYWTVYYTG